MKNFWKRRDGLGIWLLFLLGCMGLPCGGGGPPAPDQCSGAGSGAIDTLEIGTSADPFTPLHDGDEFATVRGGQGADMVPIRLRITGATRPACLDQVAIVRRDDLQIGRLAVPLHTYDEGPGASVTKPLYVVLDSSDPRGRLNVEVTALGKKSRVFFGPAGPPDASALPDLTTLPDDLAVPTDLSPDDSSPPDDLPPSD